MSSKQYYSVGQSIRTALACLSVFVAIMSLGWGQAAWADSRSDFVRQIRNIETSRPDQVGQVRFAPAGLAFSDSADRKSVV